MKLFTKLFAGAALVASSFAATAQDGPELTISGSVDAYFRSNFSPTNNGPEQAPGTSFANGNGFSLGMANVVLGLEGEKSGFVADLVFGPRGADAVFGSQQGLSIPVAFDPATGEPTEYEDVLISGNSTIVNQLYAYWNVSDAATLTIGNFNTFLGYEVISPAANFNYSTSYMFSYGPFSHSGLKLDYAISDDVSAMIGVFNPTDMTEYNPVDTYTVGAQLGVGGVYLNLLYGDQTGSADNVDATFQVDLTAGWDLTDAFYFGLNTTYNTTSVEGADDNPSFYGVAGYLQYALSDAFSLGTRIEYFGTSGYIGIVGEDEDGKGSALDITVSAPYKVGDLTIIPEVRFDTNSEKDYIDGDGMPTESLSSFTLAAVYAF
ncbi:outer membrane beta-barrel protein [Reichenbachiella versicolor]|uniref:outer membrane beta-barrel protein n=1 Tax=Reichenbachiella versicolor TaxID=1821036 RepID=UPI000D6EA10F|nr:outer membrane beta-barrel protein [Reichenbachiella versicolor]